MFVFGSRLRLQGPYGSIASNCSLLQTAEPACVLDSATGAFPIESNEAHVRPPLAGSRVHPILRMAQPNGVISVGLEGRKRMGDIDPQRRHLEMDGMNRAISFLQTPSI